MFNKVLSELGRIEGVEFKALVSHRDQRGFFREIIRVSDSFFGQNAFAQWSHSKMARNVVKAWHYHFRQTDWWYVPLGKIQAVLFDNRPQSATYRSKLVFFMGESDCHGTDTLEVCVKIPTGVLHGLKVYSDTAHLFYITSNTYNPNDEGRFPFDSDIVAHNWGSDAITSEQDRRTFVPTV